MMAKPDITSLGKQVLGTGVQGQPGTHKKTLSQNLEESFVHKHQPITSAKMDNAGFWGQEQSYYVAEAELNNHDPPALASSVQDQRYVLLHLAKLVLKLLEHLLR